jgi:hypothetical protein
LEPWSDKQKALALCVGSIIALIWRNPFFVGAGLTKEDLKKIGKGALLKAVTLWVLVSLLSLVVIKLGFIHLGL